MQQIKLAFYGFKAMIVMLVLFSLSTSIYAKNNDCWVDLYDDTQFAGDHIRLKGPIQLASLQKVQWTNWDKKIESIKVGPKATLTVFEKKTLN